ncbi:flagellar basal body P-ring formation protein FlgA [Devosia sp. MC532]|uniref:flagellar basal body P-ring formation chaperone FlgA n=1 Tax=Devosia sp. MC532 TaxID=2799788 RepID=UPI0018F702BF|nr:flagellar basal body P-ring formation chaperone FlgA [Devosia sp. MC532]MBJ7577119.1 flagellar basal body P-ring formation protein FlgA [Devosia sp. MC532]
MSALRSVTLALSVALSCSCAFAMPLMKSDVTISSAIVTFGDMFDNAGADAEKALFRAPNPGTTGDVDVNTVRQAAKRIGVPVFDTNGLEQVRVSRSYTLVDQAMLTELIEADLRQKGVVTGQMQVQAHFNDGFEPIKAADSFQPAKLDALRYLPGSNSFTARYVIEGVGSAFTLSGTLDLLIEAPHLVAALPAGAVLAPEHISMRPISVKQADAQGIPHYDQLIGKALNRPSRDGMLLRATDVSVPLTIAKNDLVTIVFNQGPMTLTVKGQAITSAAQGEAVQVLNLASRRIISATAISPGAVAVSTAPMNIAGL